MRTVRYWFTQLSREDAAQDLVEYSLLVAFVAMAAVGVLSHIGVTAQGPWSTANASLESAGTTATTTTPPSGGGQGDRDHGDHQGH